MKILLFFGIACIVGALVMVVLAFLPERAPEPAQFEEPVFVKELMPAAAPEEAEEDEEDDAPPVIKKKKPFVLHIREEAPPPEPEPEPEPEPVDEEDDVPVIRSKKPFVLNIKYEDE